MRKYDLQFKLKVLSDIERGMTWKEASRLYEINEMAIARWKRDRDVMFAMRLLRMAVKYNKIEPFLPALFQTNLSACGKGGRKWKNRFSLIHKLAKELNIAI